ncbi:MAG: sulfotransferase family protein [Geminicoccaceae bacterium]
MPPTTRPQLVFVLALTGRSGTNHLLNLISHHPNIEAASKPFWEDFLLHEAHHLKAFADNAYDHWSDVAGDHALPTIKADLKAALGETLCRFLTRGVETPFVVAKTPSIQNIGMIDQFFPEEKLIVILRDGRDVMASGMRSFGWSLDESAGDWADAADQLLAFCEAVPRDRRLIVRFEDLVADPARTLETVFRHIGVDPNAFNWNETVLRQVIGSSSLRPQSGDLDWKPIDKTKDFDPIGRWQGWTEDEKRRFDSRAGRQLRALKTLT